MTERKAGAEVMMQLLVQSLKIVRGFHKSKLNLFIFFSSIMQPKTLKLAMHEHKVLFYFKGLKKYSSREPVSLKRWVLFQHRINLSTFSTGANRLQRQSYTLFL
jgi:hypothetical protein